MNKLIDWALQIKPSWVLYKQGEMSKNLKTILSQKKIYENKRNIIKLKNKYKRNYILFFINLFNFVLFY
jgi:hypothetical protein